MTALAQKKTLFPIVTIDDITPMNSEKFYQYLHSIEVPGKPVQYIPALTEYLALLGFDKTQHFIEERVITLFRYCHENYIRNWVPDRTPMAMDELFEHDPEGKPSSIDIVRRRDLTCPEGFTISGKPGTFKIKPKLMDLLQCRSLIYFINAYNFHFEVNNNQLHIRYQFIIGGRIVCNLKE